MFFETAVVQLRRMSKNYSLGAERNIHVTSSISSRCRAGCTAESKPARCNSSARSLWIDLDATEGVIDGSGGSGRDISGIGVGLRSCGC